jgi:hypothetical protein
MQCPGYTFMKRQTIGKTYAPLIEAEVRENYLTRLKTEAQRFGIVQATDGVSNRKIPWMAFLCLFHGVLVRPPIGGATSGTICNGSIFSRI